MEIKRIRNMSDAEEEVPVNANEEVAEESDEHSEEEEEVKDTKIGDKKRDLWEQESSFEKTARKAKYKVVVGLQDEKDKSI